jgi:hypothetical protein
MQLRSWSSVLAVAAAFVPLGTGFVGCTSTPKDDGSSGKDVVDADGPNLRASLAPGTFKLPLTFDVTSFAYDDAVLSLVCQGTRTGTAGPQPQRQADETTSRNSRVAFAPGAGGTHTLSVVLKSRLSAKVHADDFDRDAPCFVEVRVDLIAKADDSHWRIVYSPRFAATDDDAGAATAQALQTSLGAAPAMRFNTIMMDAGGTGKVCADAVPHCPWSASRLRE